MGLTIVVGKKGSGKSAFALGQIERELIRGKRLIVTNLQVYVDRLEQHLRDCGYEVAVADRLIVRDVRDNDFARWWRIRGHEVWGAFGQDERWNQRCEGIFFVLDEGQHYFSARGWLERQSRRDGEVALGVECGDYLSQERKTGDDTLVTTPSSSLLDKQFRTLSTECVVLDNWYKKRIRFVKPPGRFQVAIYENCPPQVGEEPTGRPHFHLDTEGLMSCYNTAAGAGFVGKQADKESEVRQGVPLSVVLAGLPVFGLAAWLVLHFGLHGVVSRFSKKVGKEQVQGAVERVTPAVAVNKPMGVSEAVALGVPNRFMRREGLPSPVASSYAYFPSLGVCWVESGGRIVEGRELREVPRGVVLDGRRYEYRPAR